ncbi:hypothetical protein LOAG_11174 [Loa loa]|uniref:Uncharacterized protein n=1 Tax=Loa loa TaxID=7209 RepID=A0A1S0TPM4_LOALO|nr:hypothetical protein LOAG_11174 [Loa loa]EFO17321.2 hypothetical protein LOAG_11174 [Loa loa]
MLDEEISIFCHFFFLLSFTFRKLKAKVYSPFFVVYLFSACIGHLFTDVIIAPREEKDEKASSLSPPPPPSLPPSPPPPPLPPSLSPSLLSSSPHPPH